MSKPSKVKAAYKRHELYKSSKLAVASALRIAASRPENKSRNFVLRKCKRLESCAVTAYSRIVTPNNNPSFLYTSNKRRCHMRGLCMSCEAERARKYAADLTDLFEHVFDIEPRARVLMLTLTSRNSPLSETAAMLRDHRKALKRFFSCARIMEATLGQFGNIEIDFSERHGDIFAHVHSHHLLVVEPAALSDHRYIRQAEYVALWQRALKIPYKPIVDIRAIRSRSGQKDDPAAIRDAVREVCKYCLDTKGFLAHRNGDIFVRPEVAATFALATHRVRFTSMDRIFLAARKLRTRRNRAGAHASQDNTSPDPFPHQPGVMAHQASSAV